MSEIEQRAREREADAKWAFLGKIEIADNRLLQLPEALRAAYGVMFAPCERCSLAPNCCACDEYPDLSAALQGDQAREAPATVKEPLAEVREKVARIVREQMREWWDEICQDTGCHPLDLKHGRGKVLFYEPNHWTDAVARYATDDILALLSEPQP